MGRASNQYRDYKVIVLCYISSDNRIVPTEKNNGAYITY